MDQRWNRLIVGVALLALAFGGWSLWTSLDELRTRARSEEEITQACGGLVDPDKVLSLHGGVKRVEADDIKGNRIGALDRRPATCVIRRTGAPLISGPHFILHITPRPNDQWTHVIGSGELEPFEDSERARADDLVRQADLPLEQPLGDGYLGSHTRNVVRVKAVCTPAETNLTSVSATAVADAANAEDRMILAGLARQAAEKAAAELGCSAALGELPQRLDAPTRRLGAAAATDGSCAWYARFLRSSDHDGLPDRALSARLGNRAWTESCLLALSGDHYTEIRELFSLPKPWWMQTESFFGDDTQSVLAEGSVHRNSVPTGTAGGGASTNSWWASSICRGQPALHTLTVSYPLVTVVRGQLPAIFRAYVDDVTARRGCTDVKFPSASTFEEVKEPPRGSGRSRTPSSH